MKPERILKNFRANVTWLMEERGMSRKDLCAATKITASQLCDLMKQDSYPTIPTICRIAEALGVHPAELLEG